MAGNWDPLGGSGGAPATSGADPLSSSPAAGGWDPLGGGTSHAPAKKSGRGLLGGIVHGLGSAASSAFGVIKGVPSVVGTLATAIPKELAPSNPFKMQHALPASQRGWQNVKKEMPLTAGSLGSLAQTARQIPDTAIGSLEPGVGFGKTNLGRQVKQQGVLNTGIAKAADLSMLLGGVGAIGEGLGAGRLARIAKLDDIANASIKAGQFGKIADATDAATQATKAAAAGDVERATNLDSISKTLAEKEGLVAQGPGSLGEKVTAGAAKGAKLGAKIAGGPAEVWTKPLGLAAKGLGAIPGVEEGVAAVSEAAKNSKLGKGRAASKVLKEAASENITGEQARLNHSVFQGFKAAKDIVGKDEHAQAAVILDRIGTAKAAGQHLAGLSDDELSRALGVHAKPEAFKLAHDYAAGTLAPETAAKLDAAGKTLEEQVYKPKQQRFLKGYGEAKKVSSETLASRAAEVANPHEPSPMGLAKETERRQAPIMARSEKVTNRLKDEANKLDKAAPKLSTAEERRIAKVTERAKRADLTAKGEAARADRLAGSVLREQARNAETAASREGQVIGRARTRLEEAGQLDTGLQSRQRQTELAARRAEATAAKGEKFKLPEGAAPGDKTVSVLEQSTTRGVDAAAARAKADEVKGVKPARTRGQVQGDVSRDSRLANEKSKAESSTANRLQASEAKRQGTAQTAAESRAAKAAKTVEETQTAADAKAAERLQTSKDRASKALAEARAKYSAEHVAAKGAAADSLVAQPASTRATLYQLRDIRENLTKMADEAETAGDTAKATDLRARADALPKTAKDLKAAGVTPKYVYGGENAAEGIGGKATPKLTGRKTLGTSRLKETGVVPTSFEGQTQKALENARGTARNEFSPKLAGHLGNASTKTVITDHPQLQGLKGEELGAALKDAGYRAWDPNGSGRVIPESDWHKLTADTPIIPREFAGRVDQMVRVPTGEEETYAQLKKRFVGSKFDRLTQGARFAKLFEPGWQLKKTLGDPAMMAAMGVTPAHVAVHLPEALRAVRSGELTPHLGAAGEGRMAMDAPKTKLGGAARKTANAMFTPFQKADALAREIAYRAKIADGLSPQAAAAATRRGLGDLHDLTSVEQNVAKRVFTFYPWQKHVAQTMLRVPLEHPAGLMQAAHIQQLANPDGTKSPNTLEQETNPFESSVMSMIHGSAADKQTGALGSQVNPAIRALFGGALGVSPSHGFSAISTPGQQFGAGPQLGFAVKHPAEFAKFVGHMLPPVVTAQNLANTKPAPGGKIPQRFETGEPIRHGVKNTGAPKAATAGARTRADALKQILGLPLPAPKLKKKK